MIEISRQVIRQVRTVFGRALGKTPKGQTGPWVTFAAGPAGVTLRAASGHAAIQYHDPTPQAAHGVAVPLALLTECGGRKSERLQLRTLADGTGEMQWSDAGVLRRETFAAASATGPSEFPALPAQLSANPPELLAALRNACEVTDQAPSRYALNCVQLRGGGGRVTGTDGRQLFVHAGFVFPWTDDLLFQQNGVIGCSELPTDQPVQIGQTEQHVALVAGPWTVWLPIIRDGRFPDIERQLRPATQAVGRLTLDANDSRFLLDRLQKLPGHQDDDQPVTLDLNGQVIVRARGEQTQATEIVLTGSSFSGTPLQLSTNRRYLLQALSMGFREVSVFGSEIPAMCHAGQRHYIWVTLEQKFVGSVNGDATRLASSLDCSANEPSTPAAIETLPAGAARSDATVGQLTTQPGELDPEVLPVEPPSEAANRTSESLGAVSQLTTPLEQALAVKTQLREALNSTNRLIQSLRHQRRSARDSARPRISRSTSKAA